MPTDTAQAARTQAIREVLKEHARVVWANRLDARMEAMGLGTQHVADAVGTTYQTIWKIRRGELYPREYLRIAIALAMGADPDQLFPMPTREAIVAGAEKQAVAS